MIVYGFGVTTTWAGDGIWAPVGGYARVVPTLVMFAWLAAVSVILMRPASTACAPDQIAVPAA